MPPASSTKQNNAYAKLKQLAASADFKPGDKLPPLRQLARQFESNLNAIYIAVRKLEHEGLVVTHHGKGVFIAPVQTRMRNVLLLTRIQGHLWSELTQYFIQQFTNTPQDRLIIEHIPDEKSGQLPAFREKLKAILDNGIDTVIFNGMSESNIQLVFDDLPADIQKLCVVSRKAIPRKNVGGVVSDWYHGGYLAAKHLIETNARHLVQIMPNNTGQMVEIARGSEAAVAEQKTNIQLSRFVCPNFAGDAVRYTRELLEQFPETDGIFTHGDFAAVPLIRCLQAMGKNVPKDIAVVGYYDTPWVELSSPTLTSINLSCEEMVSQVVQMYLAGDFQSQAAVHPKLMVRESTGR